MADYISGIQDSLRRSGYPINNTKQVQEISFGPQGAKTSTNWRWEFLSKDQTRGVVVNEGFAVVQTSAYSDFDDFHERILDAVKTVSDVVGGLLVTRIGLRYVDLIRPLDGESWEEYVCGGMRGFSGKHYEQKPLQLHQVIGTTGIGQMHVRLLQNRQGVFLPPDLLEAGLSFRVPRPKPDELFTILDMDHFTTLSDDFDPEMIKRKFWQLKNVIHKTFMQELVTEHALKVWK